MPIQSREDAEEVESRIEGIFGTSADTRAEAVRGLFVEVLDFNAASGQVDLSAAASSAGLPAFVERVAYSGGVHVVFLATEAARSDRVQKAELASIAKSVAEQLGGDLLLVVTNPSSSQLHLVYPSFEGVRPILRRMVVERDLPRRTAIQQVSNIYWNRQDTGSIQRALDEAFDVEPVTKEFFREYKRVFEEAKQRVAGFDDDTEAKHRFVQTLFNRLMFVYFLSRKGWLSFKGKVDYLNALWNDYPNDGEVNFYQNRLRPLFFSGLNNPQFRDFNFRGSYTHTIIGDAHFLNGGLFEESNLDRREGVTVPDEVVEAILSDLFDHFNFTVLESTPFDVEVAVDPEMLGKVFEELVTGRHDSGAYYTPRTVVAFMCREALKGYLLGRDTGLDSETIAQFVDNRDTSGITSVASARGVAQALYEVTVVDPACGSGAYLLGMMQELVELQTTLFNVGADAKGIYDLKLRIIEGNLYGIDIDDFAVNIAMLRLWLSLAIEYEDVVPQPLPNLDFKVVCGDSLLGTNPSAESYGDLFRHRAHDIAAQLAEAKARHMAATTGKEAIRHEIERMQENLKEVLADSPAPKGAVDWRVHFAEVFDRGGFDVAIANPPYIQLQGNAGLLANQYKNSGYETFARTGDIYQLFYERGCQALKPANGLLAYITSNSWLKAEYGKVSRKYLSEKHTPLSLMELGKDVFASAIVDSGVLVLRTGGSSTDFPGVDMDRLDTKEVPPHHSFWGSVRPDGDAPWSILSPVEQRVLEKMHALGIPLKDWDIAIYRGITTGLNDAFIIDNQTKERLVSQDPRSEEIIKPVLRGRDIERYRARWAGMWLIDTHNGYKGVAPVEIDSYPAIKAYLNKHNKQLANRYDKGRTPYNLRNCAYHAEFVKEKLFWIDLTEEGRFAYDDGEMFCVNSAYMLTGNSLKYLCAVLNSTLVTWFMRSSALNSGMGTTRWVRFTVDRIPVPTIDSMRQRPFIQLVDKVLDAQSAKTDTLELETDIDRQVYALYGLTEDEVQWIASR